MIPLRQNTAKTLRVGPFYDPANVVLTGLTIAQSDRQLSKDGGAFAQSGQAGNATHDTDGFYSVTLAIADTDTVGSLKLAITMSGALAVWEDCYVYEEAVFDALFASGASGYSTHSAADVINPLIATGDANWATADVSALALEASLQTLRNQEIIQNTAGQYSIPMWSRADPYTLLPGASITSATVRIDDATDVDISGQLSESGAANGFKIWNYTGGSTNGANLEILIQGPNIVDIPLTIRTVPP